VGPPGHCCEWQGIACKRDGDNNNNNNITSLELFQNNLQEAKSVLLVMAHAVHCTMESPDSK
jgi:hypothetical protein